MVFTLVIRSCEPTPIDNAISTFGLCSVCCNPFNQLFNGENPLLKKKSDHREKNI